MTPDLGRTDQIFELVLAVRQNSWQIRRHSGRLYLFGIQVAEKIPSAGGTGDFVEPFAKKVRGETAEVDLFAHGESSLGWGQWNTSLRRTAMV